MSERESAPLQEASPSLREIIRDAKIPREPAPPDIAVQFNRPETSDFRAVIERTLGPSAEDHVIPAAERLGVDEPETEEKSKHGLRQRIGSRLARLAAGLESGRSITQIAQDRMDARQARRIQGEIADISQETAEILASTSAEESLERAKALNEAVWDVEKTQNALNSTAAEEDTISRAKLRAATSIAERQDQQQATEDDFDAYVNKIMARRQARRERYARIAHPAKEVVGGIVDFAVDYRDNLKEEWRPIGHRISRLVLGSVFGKSVGRHHKAKPNSHRRR